MRSQSFARLRNPVVAGTAVVILLNWRVCEAQAWTKVATLTPEIFLGVRSVAISGPHVALGGHTGQLLFDSGAAVIFEAQHGEWQQSQTIVPDELTRMNCGSDGCNFGVSAALEGDRLIVGASYIDKVFVYERAMDEWQLTAVLSPEPHRPFSDFGRDVDLQGNRLAVSAPSDNRIYIYDLVNDAWSLTTELKPRLIGAPFGQDISLDGDRVLASGEDTACLFESIDGTNVEVSYLSPANLPRGNFGVSVALDGNHALVGADFQDQLGVRDAGAAYVFTLQGDDWVATDRLVPADPKPFGHFGRTVSLDDGRALIAGRHHDELSGEAYIFEAAPGGDWRQTATLPLDDFNDFTQRIAVELDGNTAIVGGRGKALIFAIPEPSALSLAVIIVIVASGLCPCTSPLSLQTITKTTIP